MALFGIGKTKVLLELIRDGTAYQTVCQDITITREPNVASRLTTKIYRDQITAECGDILRLTIDEQHHQFMGVITETNKSKEWCSVTAYDQIYYLNRNHIYYSYEEKTASEVLKEIVQKEELKMVDPSQVMDCSYVIPYRIEDNVTPLDIITTALDLEYKHTGVRFFLWDDCGNICLHTEEWLKDQPHIVISMGFIEDYNFGEDMNDIYTKITVVSQTNSDDESEGERTFYTAEDEERKERYGLLEYPTTLGQDENGDELAQKLLEQYSKINQHLTISGCQGDIVVRGGTPVFVDFYGKDNKEYIRGFFRTESVTHYIKAGHHTMDLSLSLIEMYDDWSDRAVGKSS